MRTPLGHSDGGSSSKATQSGGIEVRSSNGPYVPKTFAQIISGISVK